MHKYNNLYRLDGGSHASVLFSSDHFWCREVDWIYYDVVGVNQHLLSGPDVERPSLYCALDTVECDRVRIGPSTLRALEGEMWGNACGCICVGALSGLPLDESEEESS